MSANWILSAASLSLFQLFSRLMLKHRPFAMENLFKHFIILHINQTLNNPLVTFHTAKECVPNYLHFLF